MVREEVEMITQTEFDAAHAQWYRETCFHSFPWTILKGAGFEKIKTFGKEAIPFMLTKLQESLKDDSREIQVWGIQAYLAELTEVDIFVGEEDEGFRKIDVHSTSEAWIKWGKENGHLDP